MVTDQNVLIEQLRNDIEKFAQEYTYSFLSPEDVKEYAPTNVIYALMKNSDTGEEVYLPVRIESATRRVLHQFDHPGYTPAIKTLITMDVVIEEKGNS